MSRGRRLAAFAALAALICGTGSSVGDHLHAVWRDFANGGGADLLVLHSWRAHGLRLAGKRQRV